MKIRFFIVIAILLIAAGLPANAAEYFVGKHGKDTNDGRSRPQAFLTTQKGVDALQPGDTLTIAPGEYFEAVSRDGLGSVEAQTTIRAELPGTVLLRGDVSLDSSAFKKVEGTQYTYYAQFNGPVEGVNEVDSLTRMPVSHSVQELEYSHGMSFYDAAQKRLYISTSDMQPPLAHHYTVSSIRKSGLLLTQPRRVTIDGIGATGFQSGVALPYSPGYHTVWGILLDGARQCVIRNSIAYLNGSGIGFGSDGTGKDGHENGWNLFEKCTGYANGSRFGGEGGNIIGFHANHDEMRDSYSYLGADSGLRFYGAGIRGPAVIKNSISWGSAYADIFIKGGEQAKYSLVENSITLGMMHTDHVKNSIIGTTNQYNSSPGKDTVYELFSPWANQQTAEANRNQWFADHLNLDFRLQETAALRGTGPDGSDPGPYPYMPNIFYVSQIGDNNSDGLSMTKSWRTLAFALAHLRPGDTLYLDEGTYDLAGAEALKVVNGEGQKVSIRGRGTAKVVVRGDMRVEGSNAIEFERLNFTGTVSFAESRDVSIKNCRFSSATIAIQGNVVKNLKLSHNEFTGFKRAAIALEKSEGVWLDSNVFDNALAPGLQLDAGTTILYSDYNSYSRAANVWSVGGVATTLAALQTRSDKYSRIQAAQYVVEFGFPRLQNTTDFDFGGLHGARSGYYRDNALRQLKVTQPIVHSFSDTTANLEWRTSVPAVTTLAWGETPDTPKEMLINLGAQSVADGFNSYTLSGLKPNTKYYYRVKEVRALEHGVAQLTQPVTTPMPVLTFTTASEAALPRTLYVAPDGNDAQSGLERTQALKTVNQASTMARPGDTILIAGGTYTETVRMRASGTAEQPITFKAMPGEEVIFDGKERAAIVAISLLGKEHIILDSLYFRTFGEGGWRGVVDLRQSNHIRINRCFFNNYGLGVPGTLLRAHGSEDIVIRNSVFSRGFQAMYITSSSKLNIENNVFMNNLICPILNSGGGPKDLQIKNNIFVDSIPSKVGVLLFELGGFEQYVFDNNAFYLRWPDEKRKPLFFYGGGEPPYRLSVEEFDQRTGLTNLVVDDPQFAITQGVEKVDETGAKLEFWGDWIPRADLDFPDLYVVNPELVDRKIGLLPDEFADFKFDQPGNGG